MNSPSRQIYWKQAENGLIAHVYEHVVCLLVDMHMQSQNNLSVIDYDLWAHTYGKTAFLELRIQTQEVEMLFHELLNNAQKSIITDDIIHQAITECSCEYQRLIKKMEDSFMKDIQTLHTTKWQTIASFSVEQADEKTSVDTLFTTDSLGYGKRSPRSFSDIFIEYSVDENVYQDNPALKALAILCVQALALNLNLQLKSRYTYYDTGDEWAEGAKEIGYRMKLRFPKSKCPGIDELGSIFADNLDDIRRHNDFSQKLAHLLNNNYSNPDLYYFDQYMMNRISDGIVIGGEGWKSIAKERYISKILQSIAINVYGVSQD